MVIYPRHGRILKKSIFDPKFFNVSKNFIVSNCKFFMRTHPRQVNYDKRKFFQPQIFTRLGTRQPNFKKIAKNAFFPSWALIFVMGLSEKSGP